MRSHTTLRTAFRFGMMTAVAAGVSFAATPARADVAPTGDNTSTGTAALKFDYLTGLDTSIDTGWLGPAVAQIRGVIKIDPVKGGGPLYSVEMPKGAVVAASWSGDKKIVLKAVNGAQTDGAIKVRHTLTPSLELKVAAFGLTATFGFDANTLINKLPGAKFAYDSRATKQFAPWGFAPVQAQLTSPDLANSVLFAEPFTTFDFIMDPNDWQGSFGVRAVTKPTFEYKTTRVMLSGSDKPITAIGAQAVMDAIDGDFMEVMAQVSGDMNVAGSLDIQPYVQMTKAFGYDFTTTIAINAFSFKYTTPVSHVAFQTALVHIPLPNVRVPTEGVNLGDVKPGGSATKSITIKNTGEKAATMTFKSSEPSFTVPGGVVNVGPKGSYTLQVKFSSNSANPALSDITVASNDPDSPTQNFQIGANGADVGNSGDGKHLNGDPPSADNGCGCKTAGSTTSTGGWASIGLVGLGAIVFVRRRRAAARAA